MTEKTIHEGRNVKRIREILGVKQETLAGDLGLTQQAVSALEQKEALDKDMLEKIAAVLKVPAEAIKNFDEEKAIYNIQHNSDTASNNAIINYQFNPIEKLMETMEENKKLYRDLLKEKDEKIALLERMMERR